ncbi:hypothetical protein TorRG33x02_281070 [Trema orientale]|uniref:Uncharacterized protein n=1 Tax=Trema orientale TaxID=63057 RepID=A0A2P5CKX4_TREOI|nr:hypothetical protein TorRG33x02_281070 [Trema orientale]
MGFHPQSSWHRIEDRSVRRAQKISNPISHYPNVATTHHSNPLRHREDPSSGIQKHVQDEDPGLHGHEFVELGGDLVVGGGRGDDTPVRDSAIDALQSVGQVRNDPLAVLVVDVDGHRFAPSEGLDDGANGAHLRRVVCGHSEEVGASERGE